MNLSTVFTGRNILPVIGAGCLLWPCAPAEATHPAAGKAFRGEGSAGSRDSQRRKWPHRSQVLEEFRSCRHRHKASNKIVVETEQAGDRIDVTSTVVDFTAKPSEMEADFQLTVPEATELQLKTQTGLIYVEQVTGDMTLDSVAGDIHLKEVSGYIIVTTTGGSLVCTQCAGKLEFTSISGSAQVLQPALDNVKLRTMTGNILFDGDFVHTGLYSMRSGKGLVEVRFSGNDSFDLNAQTATGTVDNQAAEYLKPDSHGVRHMASKFSKGLFGTVGMGLAKVELSSYSGTIRILKRD